MSFNSLIKLSELSPLDVINRLTVKQHWNLLEMNILNKENWSELSRKCHKKFGLRKGLTVPRICMLCFNNIDIYWANGKLHDVVDFTKNKLSFRLKLIFILVGTII